MKDNLPILEVKALGGFSMRYGEKTIVGYVIWE